MSDQEKGSAQSQDAGGNQESKDKVSYDTYSRVLSEAKKLKDKVKQFEEQQQKMTEDKLKEQNEWKTLADSYKQQLDQTSSRLQEQESTIINGIKYQAFEKHLGGKLKNDAYSSFVPFDKIILDPESKRVNEDSVKLVVNDFVKNHASLVEFQQAKMPSQAPASFSGEKQIKKPSEMNQSEIGSALKENLSSIFK